MMKEIFLCDAKIEVEEVEQLPFHQIDFCKAKAKTIITLHVCVSCPVLVFRTGIVQILCSEDQRRKEDSVYCAAHALCNRWKTRSESVEVH